MPDDLDIVSISEFKATCLARLERVRRTGRRLLVTRRGQPIAEIAPPSPPRARGSWLGRAASTGTIKGDLIEPLPTDEWDAFK